MNRVDHRTPPKNHATRWLDLVKATAILWIFLNHTVERLLGSPYIANPSSSWPTLSERIAQLAPVDYGGAATDVVLNSFRYLGWAGDQGVQLFLIASGFGLTWSMLERNSVGDWFGFLKRRFWRIFPLWWGAHIAFLVLSAIVGGRGMHPFDPQFYLSFLGFRASPEMMYYFSPAWWYIGLIIQLYLVFPLLLVWLKRLGAGRFLVMTVGISIAVRLAGLLVFDSYLDTWSRGGIFISRIPEFAFGMALAWWLQQKPSSTDRLLRNPLTLVASVLLYVVATGLALTLSGMAVAPFLHGVAAFVWLYSAFRSIQKPSAWIWRGLAWIGTISYALYLTHHPVTLFLLGKPRSPGLVHLAMAVPVFLLALVLAVVLDRTVNGTLTRIGHWSRERGVGWIISRILPVFVILMVVIFGTEIAIRTLDPQETNGWGERPSLEAHPEFGWRLTPNQTTRLRWESYDYVVDANELGFPGPLYPETRSPNTVRILTLGDAFTSAEGVDTDKSWPRLLEEDLNLRVGQTQVEVLNFAITGYGPNQYAAVFERFGSRYRPDIVIIGFFVNEFSDVLWSNDDFNQSIGFGTRSQDGLLSYIEAAHLRRWLQLNVSQPLRERITGKPRNHGYFLANIRALEVVDPEASHEARGKTRLRLAEIAQLGETIGAAVIVMLIPAPVQICNHSDLDYLPQTVNLSDTRLIDMDQPQRWAKEITDELGIRAYDLRDTLRALDSCPYQPRNMHWLPQGHDAVADSIAASLVNDGVVSAEPRFEVKP